MFQSTRPHGARPRRKADAALRKNVSIHAPAWGATKMKQRVYRVVGVSIHAPAWGATYAVR